MKVYLGPKDEQMVLPVAPEKITKSIKNQNSSKKLINGEEINIPLPVGLLEIKLSNVLLPRSAYDFVASDDSEIRNADYYLNQLDTFKRGRKVIALTINESTDGLCEDAPAQSLDVTVENYQITQESGNGDNIEVEINLKEYREYGLTVYPVETTSTGTTVIEKTSKRTEKEQTETDTWTVKPGDTLWGIAKKFYGDGSLYPYLASINNISNPNIIRDGQVLKIGPASEAKAYKASNKATTKTTTSSASSNTGTSTASTSKVTQAEIDKAHDVRRLSFLYKSDEEMMSTNSVTIAASSSTTTKNSVLPSVSQRTSEVSGTSGRFSTTKSNSGVKSNGIYKSEGGYHGGSSGNF